MPSIRKEFMSMVPFSGFVPTRVEETDRLDVVDLDVERNTHSSESCSIRDCWSWLNRHHRYASESA